MKKFMKKYISVIYTVMMLQSVVYADAAGEIKGTVSAIVNVVAYFGYAVALGMLAYIAIKYMLSAASDKANMKQGLINYLIGAFLIAGASFVANTVAGFAGGSNSASDIVNKYM